MPPDNNLPNPRAVVGIVSVLAVTASAIINYLLFNAGRKAVEADIPQTFWGTILSFFATMIIFGAIGGAVAFGLLVLGLGDARRAVKPLLVLVGIHYLITTITTGCELAYMWPVLDQQRLN